jgi:hypothetical protein
MKKLKKNKLRNDNPLNGLEINRVFHVLKNIMLNFL